MTSPRQRKKRLAFKKLLEKREAENKKHMHTPTPVVTAPTTHVQSKPAAPSVKLPVPPVESKPVEPPKLKKVQPKNALVEIEPLKQKQDEVTVTPEKTEVKEEKSDV